MRTSLQLFSVKDSISQILTTSIEDSYEFSPIELGTGSFGKVIKAKCKANGKWRAIKIIPKVNLANSENIKNEIGILSDMNHSNIIKLFESYEDDKCYYLVMEFCEGGDLYDKITTAGFFVERDAKILFKAMVEAIRHCHSKNVCHRDIKPENFVFTSKNKLAHMKLIDFGLSLKLQGRKRLSKAVGTIYFIAPEVFQGSYDYSCDIWSLGVTLYLLVSGVVPFDADNDSDIKRKIKEKKINFEIPQFKYVSSQVKDLISKCLSSHYLRPTASDILEHPWLRELKTVSENNEKGSKTPQLSSRRKLSEVCHKNQINEARLQIKQLKQSKEVESRTSTKDKFVFKDLKEMTNPIQRNIIVRRRIRRSFRIGESREKEQKMPFLLQL